MGGVGGVRGADRACNDLAQTADLPGTYKAWLSDTNHAPVTTFVRNPGPYVRTDGATVANNWSDLTDGKLAAPINLTELATQVPFPYEVWTNTEASGQKLSAKHCNNWTYATGGAYNAESIGRPAATDANWTNSAPGGEVPCDFAARLYCFQQS